MFLVTAFFFKQNPQPLLAAAFYPAGYCRPEHLNWTKFERNCIKLKAISLVFLNELMLNIGMRLSPPGTLV